MADITRRVIWVSRGLLGSHRGSCWHNHAAEPGAGAQPVEGGTALRESEEKYRTLVRARPRASPWSCRNGRLWQQHPARAAGLRGSRAGGAGVGIAVRPGPGVPRANHGGGRRARPGHSERRQPTGRAGRRRAVVSSGTRPGMSLSVRDMTAHRTTEETLPGCCPRCRPHNCSDASRDRVPVEDGVCGLDTSIQGAAAAMTRARRAQSS